jgi:membrane-associated phospholipid phosphatase
MTTFRLLCGFILASFFVAGAPSALLRAQIDGDRTADTTWPSVSGSIGDALVSGLNDPILGEQQPAGPIPTPRHTGVKMMVKQLWVDIKNLPARENFFWAGAGGGLALAVHPLDDNVQQALVGNSTAEAFFKPGKIIGDTWTLLGASTIVYVVGRTKDSPRVSHVGMDLIRAIAISEMLVQTLKYTTRRERPDGSGKNSFPSGHAADTFAFATALERHLGWRYAVPGYIFSSYVAMSRLTENRHWLSDVVFGSAVGIIAGRTVTGHEEVKYPVQVTLVPGGAAILFVRRNN